MAILSMWSAGARSKTGQDLESFQGPVVQRLNWMYMCYPLVVRSLSAKYRPDRYRRDKSVKFGTELP